MMIDFSKHTSALRALLQRAENLVHSGALDEAERIFSALQSNGQLMPASSIGVGLVYLYQQRYQDSTLLLLPLLGTKDCKISPTEQQMLKAIIVLSLAKQGLYNQAERILQTISHGDLYSSIESEMKQELNCA